MEFRYLDRLFNVVLSPVGMTLASIGILVIVLSFFTSRIAIGLCAMTFWVASFSSNFRLELWGPFQFLAVNGRAITILLLAALTVTMLPYLRFPRLSWGVVGWFVFQLAWSIDFLFSGDYEKGGTGLVSVVLIFICFGIGMNGLMDSVQNARRVLNIYLLSSLIFLAGCCVQLVMDRSAVASGRFYGTSFNPQAAGWILATAAMNILAAWSIREKKSLLMRILLVGAGLLSLNFLVWTVSRTSWLMFIFGCLVFFRRRIGTLIFGFLPILIIAIAYIFWQGSAVDSDEYTIDSGPVQSSAASVAMARDLTQNTRLGMFQSLWNLFLQSPVVGQPYYVIGECSYLAVAAAMGIVGITIMGLAFLGGMVDLLRVHRYRHELCREDQVMFDYVAATLAMLGVGGLLDGTMLGLVTLWGFFPYYILTLLNYLVRRVDEAGIPVSLYPVMPDGSFSVATQAFGGFHSRRR